MRIIALETSTEACSVALYDHGIVDSLFEIIPQQHTQRILFMLQSLLDKHQLTIQDCSAIAFGEGPGSFTGLRIAAGIAQGLSFAHNLPLIPISSLAALALQAKNQYPKINRFIPMIDARMGEIYFAYYGLEKNKLETILNDRLAAPAELSNQLLAADLSLPWIGIGTPYSLYTEAFKGFTVKQIVDAYPNAAEVVQLAAVECQEGRFVELSQALPKYVRNDIAHAKKT